MAFRRHQYLYGTTEEQLAHVAVNQRRNAQRLKRCQRGRAVVGGGDGDAQAARTQRAEQRRQVGQRLRQRHRVGDIPSSLKRSVGRYG